MDAPERLAKAIQWLEQCVRQFYQIPPQAELDHSETLLLYRCFRFDACSAMISPEDYMRTWFRWLIAVIMAQLTPC